MLLKLTLPAIVRAVPPHCQNTKQVHCAVTSVVEVPVADHTQAPVVLEVHEGLVADRPLVAFRHYEGGFFRHLCKVSEAQSAFQSRLEEIGGIDLLKPNLTQTRGSVDYAKDAWPTKPKRSPRQSVPFEDVLTFDKLEETDVARALADTDKVFSSLLVVGDDLWIATDEPCYVVFCAPTQSNVFYDLCYAGAELTSADMIRISVHDFATVAATADEMALHTDRTVVDRGLLVEGKVHDTDVFVEDFRAMDIGRTARTAVSSIAHYLSRSYDDGLKLRETRFDDIDIWNALRRFEAHLDRGGLVTEEIVDTLALAVDFWGRLGGGVEAGRYVAPNVAMAVARMALDNWRGRRISFDLPG
jgi:hypothetical protein